MAVVRFASTFHRLARLEPMNQVGGKADTCGGLSTDTAFLFGNGAEGVVAVEPGSSLSRLAASQTGISAGRNFSRLVQICGNELSNDYHLGKFTHAMPMHLAIIL